MLPIAPLKKSLGNFNLVKNRRHHNIFNFKIKVMPLTIRANRGRLASAKSGRRNECADRNRKEKSAERDTSNHHASLFIVLAKQIMFSINT